VKLYVLNQFTEEKIYLKQSAATKSGLVEQLGSERFKVDGQIFSVNEVIAESNDNTAGAMAAGGVMGVVGGVPGVIIGGVIGALLGMGSNTEDKEKTEKFNRSSL